MNAEPDQTPNVADPLAGLDDPSANQVVHIRCLVRALGSSVETLRRYDHGGVMANTGTNSCLADLEHHLVRCTEILPVTVGLALKDDKDG